MINYVTVELYPLARLLASAQPIPFLSPRPSSLILPFQFLFARTCFHRLCREGGDLHGCLGCPFCLCDPLFPYLFFSFSSSFFSSFVNKRVLHCSHVCASLRDDWASHQHRVFECMLCLCGCERACENETCGTRLLNTTYVTDQQRPRGRRVDHPVGATWRRSNQEEHWNVLLWANNPFV